MRLLFGRPAPGPLYRRIYEKFGGELANLGIECKMVAGTDVVSGFPDRNPRKWFERMAAFKKIINEFKPDFVMTNQQRHFGLAAVRTGVPLLMYLEGDYWREMSEEIARISYKQVHRKLALKRWQKIGYECFQHAKIIISVSQYLDGIVRARFPQKITAVMHHGVDLEAWQAAEGKEAMNLNHPCVGFVQNANVYEKTVEMLVLSKVMQALPQVTFYWAGDGRHRDIVLSELSRYDNFKWLGNLEHPADVRRFLSSVDIYGLASGMDTLGISILEAQMMRLPVIATRVGGVPEAMMGGKTGLLVGRGDHARWTEHIESLLIDEKKRRRMGEEGRRFVEENFTVRDMAQQFSDAIRKVA